MVRGSWFVTIIGFHSVRILSIYYTVSYPCPYTLSMLIPTAANIFPITQAVYCNHVLYYWAFVDVVILVAFLGVVIIFVIVFCIVSPFLYTREDCLRSESDGILPPTLKMVGSVQSFPYHDVCIFHFTLVCVRGNSRVLFSIY